MHIEVDSGNRCPQAGFFGEAPRAEVVFGRRRNHLREAAPLLEDHKHVSMDADVRSEIVTPGNLPSCSTKPKDNKC